MNFKKYLAVLGMVLGLAACGGGGGSAGTPLNNSGGSTSGSSSNGNVQTTSVGTISIDLVNGSGISTNSISAVEIAQVKVIVKDSAGVLVSGTVVSFSESGVGLLKFAPSAKTAMTNSAGLAAIELRALDQTQVGATTVSATASVGSQTISVTKTLEITNAPATGGVVVDPQTLASSINFISTDPADKSIVLQGAGGNGRTETGILSFRVVDKNGTPVKGAVVDFVVNPSVDVTLNISQGTTDADGLVLTSVSSKTVPTSVVVKATVKNTSVSTQSDQLKVTTGLGVQTGFEILPLVYNLDGALSGDTTDITARVVDANSNPVADGVPIVFVATGGKIGTSAAGGCNTVNGKCTVPFEVQDPRPANGIVTITGSAKVGATTTLLRQINIHMSSAPLGIFEPASGVPASPLLSPLPVTLTSCAKKNKPYMVANLLGYSVPSGSAVAVANDLATGFSASISSGAVLDVGNFAPSAFDLLLDPSGANNPACNDTGIDTVNATVVMTVNAPQSKREVKVPLTVRYPAGNLFLLQSGSANTPASVTLSACSFETTSIQAIGSDNLTLPAGSTFTVASSDSSASVGISTVAPNMIDPTASTNVSNTLLLPSNNASRQSLWLRIRAPNGGVAPCTTAGKLVNHSFNVSVNVNIAGRINTQTIAVTYPGN